MNWDPTGPFTERRMAKSVLFVIMHQVLNKDGLMKAEKIEAEGYKELK